MKAQEREGKATQLPTRDGRMRWKQDFLISAAASYQIN